MIHHILILLLSCLSAIDGLEKVMIQIPQLVAPGDTITLRCLYQLEGEPLYAVNWYRGSQEFFRYAPNVLPHGQVFPQAGINVDVSQSGPHSVVLKDVQPYMAGKYRCEVSADAPHFSTEVVADFLNITLPPTGKVKLQVDKLHYFVGETLRADCTSAPSKPAANITFFLNGKMVNPSKTETHPTIDRPYYVTTATLSTVLDKSFPRAIHVLCQVNVQDNFKSSAERFVTITEEIDSYDEFFRSRSANSGTHPIGGLIILFQIAAFHWLMYLALVPLR
ncbi:uncharacterized protein [Bemisia tabaci]|uniref:uncharacterized protein n=1 Tax=Bemisia tabaci TaxID=7038 RepID=UPI003B287A4D